MNLKKPLITALALLTLAAPAAATAPQPRLSINGHEVAQTKVHLEQGRLYVEAGELAAALGATLTHDEATGAYALFTGKGIPTVADLAKLNPKLALYETLSPYIPNMGIHHGVMGPHVTLSVSSEGTVNAAEIIVPADQGWQPWFDQPKDQPMELEGMGLVYTQHIYLTNPQGLEPTPGGVPVLLDGRYLSVPYAPKAHTHGDEVFVPVRAAAELLGGQVSWDGSAFAAQVTVQPSGISYDWLKALNPKLAGYQALSPFVPNMGFHHGAHGPHLTVMVDSTNMVVGFEVAFPAAAGWAPWFDQPKDQPMELEGMGLVYTQHIYFVDPASIK